MKKGKPMTKIVSSGSHMDYGFSQAQFPKTKMASKSKVRKLKKGY